LSDPKRSGSRDISDLKARLGLKKGGAAPASGQQQRAGNGVVAPPGLNLPPPPGVQQPQQPVIPNAADDPFGAMNAMAAVGTVQRAPEIVIVNDGRPVENVGHVSTGATIAKVAIPGVIALVIGLAIGKIGTNASNYNDGLGDAKEILGDKNTPSTIISLKQTLSQIDTVLDEARTKNQFRPDAAVDKKLEALAAKLDLKSEIVFRRTKQMDTEVAGQIVSFYAGVAEVKSMLDAHLKFAKSDNNAFSKNKKATDAATLKENENAPLVGQLKYAIVLQAPTEKENVEFGAKIIELGGVYCGASANATAKCPEGEGPTGVQYRTDLEKNPIKGDIATPSTDSIPTKKVVPLLAGTIRDQFFKGAEGVATEVYYQRRLRNIYERICKRENDGKCGSNTLLDQGNRVETRVDTESKKGTRFTFFM
jgi:hypothetical protein